jgi:hypothetical protein
MKKVAIIAGIAIGVIIIAMILIPIIFKPQIVKMVKDQANKNLNATVNFGDVGLSLFSHFPNATITLEDLTIVNREPFAGDTLLSLEKFEGTANLAALMFSKKVDLVSLQLIDPKILLLKNEAGQTNWDIMPPTTQTATPAPSSSGNMNLGIRSYKIQNGQLTYLDNAGAVAAKVVGLNHQGDGDFSQQHFTLSTITEVAQLTAQVGSIAYLNEATLKIKADLDMDLAAMKFAFKDNEIVLNKLALNFNGFVAMAGDDIQIDMSFASPKSEFKDILSMIPGIYKKDFAKLKTEGQLSFQGKIQGIYGKTKIPSFDIGLNVANGVFQYSQMPAPVKQVAIDLQLKNPGDKLDDAIVDLKKFHLEILNEPIDAQLTAKKLESDPEVNGFVKGRVNLGELKNVMPLGDSVSLDGLITADFKFAGKKSAFDNNQIQQATASGSIAVTDIHYSAPTLPVPVNIKSANLALNPQQATLSNFKLLMGKSDLSAQGSLNNIIGYMFSGHTLTGTLTTESDNFDLNPFMVSEGGPLSAIPLPDRVEFVMLSHFGNVSLMNLEMKDVKGKLILKDRILNLVDLNANMLQGTMISNGTYQYIPPAKPHIDLALGLKNMSIPGMFKTFVTVQRLAPFSQYMAGSLSGNLNMNTDLGDSLIPVWSSLSSQGSLDIPQAKIDNFAPLNKVAEILKLSALNNPTMANFGGAFEIKDGRFHLKPTPLKIGQYQMTASGSNGLDKSLEYVLKIQIPAAEIKSSANSVISGLVKQDVNLLTDETVVVDVGVGGTFNDPSVKASSSEIVKSTSDQLKKTAEAEAEKQKQELKKQAEDKINQQKQDLEKATRDKAKDKLKGLFKK